MLDRNQATQVLGRDAYDTHGDKIGSIGQLYLDDTTKQPAWITVNTGFFGTHESFVPIQQAEMRDETVVVPFDKQTVKDSPSVDADDHSAVTTSAGSTSTTAWTTRRLVRPAASRPGSHRRPAPLVPPAGASLLPAGTRRRWFAPRSGCTRVRRRRRQVAPGCGSTW